MSSRKLALTRARQYRRCPPPEIAEDPSCAAYMKQHLAICPYCGAAESRRLKIWNDLSRKLRGYFCAVENSSEAPSVSAGQLHFLKPGLAGWQNGYFFNPPCVLVLGTANEIADEIFVAQVYHEIGLAGPGDLILDNTRSGAGDLFVECWNTYTLKSSYLGPIIATVTPEIIETVKTMENQADFLPDWASLPKPLTEHDPRLYFRELEVETGYVFASSAVSEILKELEKPQLDYETDNKLQEDIRKSAKVIRFPRPTSSLEETLASAKFPADAYAKAAADDDRESLPANLVALHNGKVLAFKPIQGIVTSKMRTESSLNISGAFPPIPEQARDPAMICFYWSKATGAMVPEDMHWEVSSGQFYAKFRTAFRDDEVLEFALLYEIDGE